MALKKQHFAEGEIPIFDEACIYKRGEYWQFRMWLPKENMYARKSIRNIEALLLDEVTAAELQHPSAASDALSFKSLDGVDEREQYEYLSQLLHIQKATRNKR